MKTLEIISRKEHKILLAVTLLWIVIVSLCFCSEFIISYNESIAVQQKELAILAGAKPGPNFSSGVHFPILPIHFISIFVFVTLTVKRPTISFLTSVCYFLFLTKAVIERYDNFADEEIAARTDFLSKIDFAANGLDVLAFGVLLVFLFWQISILWRGLFKNSQIKNSLP